jgi:hypothetical protein
MRFLSSLALGLAIPSVLAQQPAPGTFENVGNTLASAMMVCLQVYFLLPSRLPLINFSDVPRSGKQGLYSRQGRGESYSNQWPPRLGICLVSDYLPIISCQLTPRNRDVAKRTATPIPARTNPFCAAGMHLPDGTYAVFGGNSAIGPDGLNNDPGSSPQYDPVYQDTDGGQAIRIITSCPGDVTQPPCAWNDAAGGPQMARRRWYAGAEALANGGVVLVGGLVNGGFINRNFPNVDPLNENGQAEPTFEFYPPGPGAPQIMQFLGKTSGLNAYPLLYLMGSGKMFVQANYSTSCVKFTLWFGSHSLTANSSLGLQYQH